MPDIVTRIFRHPLHHFEHSRDNFFQDIRFLAYDFVRDPLRQRTDALQPIEKAQRDPIVFILFFQELNVKCYLYFYYASSREHEPQQ